MSIWRAAAIGVGLVLLLGAGIGIGLVAGNDASPALGPSTTTAISDSVVNSTDVEGEQPDPGSSTAPEPSAECSLPPGEPYLDGRAVSMTDLGETSGVRVEAGIYPRPDYEGNPWSQWGQGLVLGDGRFISAIGDHLGRDGNSYLYEYDPSTGSLTMIGDVLSYVDHEPGSWGYGKIHGQVVLGSCGEAYVATYWGTRSDLEYSGSYSGDVLLRIDPEGRTITNLGVPVEGHGVPSLAGLGQSPLVFGEALDPSVEDDTDGGPFFVYDTLAQEVIFSGPTGPHIGFRNIMIDASGRAYYSIGGGQLAVYNPDANDVTIHPASLPGEWLRASTSPTRDGRVFGVTEDESLFVMDSSGEITGLGNADGYTASMVGHPDGSRFFYVPEAHGDSWEIGAPLIAVDSETGEQTTLVELNPIVEQGLGLRLGGTYSMSVDPAGDRLYIGMNASTDDSGFGEVVLVIVHLS